METLKNVPKQKPKTLAPGVKALVARAVDIEAKVIPLSTRSGMQSPSETEKPKLPQDTLDKLWIKMTEMYGHRWTSNFGVSADQDHSWAKVLAGLSKQQLANGLQELVDRATEFEWPPAANVFRSLCMKLKGFPTVQQAWMEALSAKYTHEAVRIAAEATGTYDLRTAKHTDKALYQRFERNFAIVQRRAENAQPLDGRIAQGIEHESGFKAQLARSHQEARDLVAAQNIPTDGTAARALLLAKLGIRRPA